MFSPGPAPRPRSTDPDVLTACGNSSRSASRRRLPNLDHLPLSPAAPVSRSLAHPRLRTFNQVGGRQTTVQTRRQSCPNPGRMHGSRRNRKHESKWTGPQKSSRRPTATEDKSPAGEKRISPSPTLPLTSPWQLREESVFGWKCASPWGGGPLVRAISSLRRSSAQSRRRSSRAGLLEFLPCRRNGASGLG